MEAQPNDPVEAANRGPENTTATKLDPKTTIKEVDKEASQAKEANPQAEAAKSSDLPKDAGPKVAATLVPPSFSEVLKVVTLKDEEKEGKVLATLPIKKLGTNPTLKSVREKLEGKIEANQDFCYQDGSPAADSESLNQYLSHLNESNQSALATVQQLDSHGTPVQQPPKIPIPRKLFVIEAAMKKETSSSLLDGSSFSVKVMEWEIKAADTVTSGVLNSRGVVPSKHFDKGSATSLTLADLRKILSKLVSMSTSTKIHKFCTPIGETVADETTTFQDYLRLEDDEVKDTSGIPSVKVVYKLASFLNQPKIDIKDMPGSYKADMSKLSTTFFEGEKTATVPQLGQQRATLGDQISWTPTVGASQTDAAGFLTEAQWKVVLQNCGVMHGWIVDRQKNRITQAPRAAFQLKTQVSTSNSTMIASSTARGIVDDNSAEASGAQADMGGDTLLAGLSGSTKATRTIDLINPPPAIPSFRVNDNSRVEVTLSSHEFETSMAKNDFSSHSTEASLAGGYAGFSASVSGGFSKSNNSSDKATVNNYKKTMVASYLFPRADIILHPEDLEATPELKAALSKIEKHKNIRDLRQLYRNFGQIFCRQVTVGGRLQSTKIMEDTTTKTEHEQKEQLKVSVGVQVNTPIGVGAGVKHDNEKGTSNSNASADDKKKETNVFEAVGGDTILASAPLLWMPTVAKFWNWRVISRENLLPLVDTISTMAGYSQVKNHFVQAVPVLSKYIELSEGHEVKSRLRLNSDQSNLSKSHLDFTRDKARFDDPAYYLGHISNAQVTPRYLGLKDAVHDLKGDMVEYPNEDPMFTPTSYRAPVILGYDCEGKAGSSITYGQDFLNTVWSITAPFSEALQHGCRVCLTTVPLEKTIEAPEAVKFTPPPAPVVKETKPPPTAEVTSAQLGSKISTVAMAPPSSLIVFRNQQGVFLPGMSYNDESQYWRILKVGATHKGENIREGDTLRLCWAFADQTTGFRDFSDDIYGRRRTHCPPELSSNVLYLKIPWPRFESLKQQEADMVGSNAMVMGTEPGEEEAWTQMVSRPQLSRNPTTGTSYYLLQDVSFRIDLVANEGRGDTDDYLVPATAPSKDAPSKPAAPLKTIDQLAQDILEARQKILERILFLPSGGK